MKPVTIIEDEFAGLWYHPHSQVVHHKIRRFLPPGYFAQLLTLGAECLEQHGAQKWLSDDRDSVVVAQDDVGWCEKDWGPRVLEAGFEYWAIVAPTGEVAGRQKDTLVARYRQRGVTVRLFDPVEDALGWLESA